MSNLDIKIVGSNVTIEGHTHLYFESPEKAVEFVTGLIHRHLIEMGYWGE